MKSIRIRDAMAEEPSIAAEELEQAIEGTEPRGRNARGALPRPNLRRLPGPICGRSLGRSLGRCLALGRVCGHSLAPRVRLLNSFIFFFLNR